MTTRPFSYERDFARIGELEIERYEPRNADGNWLRPFWEYAYYEWLPGEAYFQTFGGDGALKREMLDYAESRMRGRSDDGTEFLKVWAPDAKPEFIASLAPRGYERLEREDRPMYGLDLTGPLEYAVPVGFTLQSLADENDLAKINRCLWRGFNHEGEPDPDLSGRRRMQEAPHSRPDLTMVVVAPGGEYVAFAGTWVEPSCEYAIVEPVATDPDYRRMGLGRAAVLGGLARCAAEGATIGYVGSSQPFYRAMGFRPVNNEECWIRRFS
ncbi:MAG: GNAT family N-acetyltransferase [bacterium]